MFIAIGLILLILVIESYASYRLYKIGKSIKLHSPELYEKYLARGSFYNRPFPFNTRGIPRSFYGGVSSGSKRLMEAAIASKNEELVQASKNISRDYKISLAAVLFILIIVLARLK